MGMDVLESHALARSAGQQLTNEILGVRRHVMRKGNVKLVDAVVRFLGGGGRKRCAASEKLKQQNAKAPSVHLLVVIFLPQHQNLVHDVVCHDTSLTYIDYPSN